MEKQLKDLLWTEELFETQFISNRGDVYNIKEIHSSPYTPKTFVPKISTRISNLLNRIMNKKVEPQPKYEFDYGIASCRLASGIRYTVLIGEQLNDRANPTKAEIKTSLEKDARLISDLGPNAGYVLF